MAKFPTFISRIRLMLGSYLEARLYRLLQIVRFYVNIKPYKRQWQKIYGNFDETNYDSFIEYGLPSESAFYHGEIVKWARDITPIPKRLLLAGDNVDTAKHLQQKIAVEFAYTTGLSNVDYIWDFEQDPPQIGQYDLIISHAVLEHLLSPYKHMCDLVSLLAPGGSLIVYTVCPGFPYHRYPIDACRFYPDWFEEVAKRLGLDIEKKRTKETDIFYMYRKRQSITEHKSSS